MPDRAQTLLAAAAQGLSSGRPTRDLLPELFDGLLCALEAGEGLLMLPAGDGHRVIHHALAPGAVASDSLEAAAARALAASPPLAGDPLAAPIRFGATIAGAVALAREREFSPDERGLVAAWAAILALSLHQHTVEEENQRLEAIAENDQLTGVANRRALDTRLRDEWERARAAGAALSSIMFDIDYFKAYNDRHGHLAGDGTLRRVAQALSGCLHRPGDFLARFGGEEFVAVLPGTGETEAIALAERMRATVFELRIPHEGSGLGIVTVSAGVATALARDGDCLELLARADAALYRAKAAGRNHVASAAYVSHSIPAAHAGSGVHGMPAMRTAFVGRQNELESLGDALKRSRLVTIAGPGGAGKTRLAMQACYAVSEAFRDGVWYYDVSPTRDAGGIFEELASLFAVQQQGTTLQGAVCERLRTARVLLLFDGCERGSNAIREVCDVLLRHTERVAILAASREVLGVPGESVHRLLGLEPAQAHRLFADLAGAGALSVGGTGAALIDSVCRRVDYLPLGIELFASQAATMPLTRLEMLVAHRMIPLQTLDDVIAWSVGLLDERRRKIFLELSVFESGFSLEAARAVARCDAADLAALESKSLILTVAAGDAPRFAMLDTMREFARRALAAGELEALRRRHFEYFSARAANAETGELDRERENLDAALAYAHAGRSRAGLLAMANALARFWLRRGYLNDGLNWLQRGLSLDGSGDDAAVALANRHAGMIYRRLGDFDASRAYNERALNLWRALDHFEGVASALNGLALVAHTTGDYDRAQILYEEALKHSDLLADGLGAAMAINNLGGLAMFRGDYAQAGTLILEAIDRAAALRDPGFEALAINNLGELRFLQRRFGETIELGKRSLQGRLTLGDRPGLAATWLLLANAFMSMERFADAWQPARESLLLYHEIGDRRGLAMALLAVARIAVESRRVEEAARLVRRADAMIERTGAPLLGADRAIREMLSGIDATLPVESPADFEGAFEDALTTFR